MNALTPTHLIIVAAIALLVFGPKKLPELARGIGEAMKEFKKTMNSHEEPEPAAPVVANASVAPEVPGAAATRESGATAGTPPQT